MSIARPISTRKISAEAVQRRLERLRRGAGAARLTREDERLEAAVLRAGI
jgi:hypothetical protein